MATMRKKKHVIDKFETMVTNIKSDIRKSGQHEIMRNCILDTDGLMKKRTGWKNIVTEVLKEDNTIDPEKFIGSKKGLFFFAGKLGSCTSDISPEGDTIKRYDDRYIPAILQDTNFISSNGTVVDYNSDDIFSDLSSKIITTQSVNSFTNARVDNTYIGEFEDELEVIGQVIFEDAFLDNESFLKVSLTYENVRDNTFVTIYSVTTFSIAEPLFRVISIRNNTQDFAIGDTEPGLDFVFKWEYNGYFFDYPSNSYKHSWIAHLKAGTWDNTYELNPFFSINLDKQIRVWQYELRADADNDTKMITDWQFEGSNNGEVWVTLDTKHNIDWRTDKTQFFIIEEGNDDFVPEPYLYYRITGFNSQQFYVIRHFNIYRIVISSIGDRPLTSVDVDDLKEAKFTSSEFTATLIATDNTIRILSSAMVGGEDVSNIKVGKLVYTEVPNSVSLINAVQFRNSLIIATGHRLIKIVFVIDTANNNILPIIDELRSLPYTPNFGEIQAIGNNIFNQDYPLDAVDIVGAPNVNLIIDLRVLPFTGIVGEPTLIRPYVATTADIIDEVYIAVFVKKNDADDFPDDPIAPIQSAGQNIIYTFDSIGAYNFKIELYAEDTGTTVVDTRYTAYNVVNDLDKNDDNLIFDPEEETYRSEREYFEEIDKCSSILISYNKIIVYGNNTENIYVSVTNNPAYFSFLGLITLQNDFAHPIINLTPYKDIMLVFTEKSISALVGAGDIIQTETFSPHQLFTLESNVGLVGSEAVAVFDNFACIATTEGIFSINQVNINERRIELAQIDLAIKNVSIRNVEDKTNVALTYWDGKLFISMPNYKTTSENIAGIEYEAPKGRIYVLDVKNNFRWCYYDSLNMGIKKFIVRKNLLYGLNNSDFILEKLPELLQLNYVTLELDKEVFKDGVQDYTFELRTSNVDLGFFKNEKNLEDITVEFSNLKSDNTNINLKVFNEGVNIFGDDSAHINQQNLEAFEFGKSYFGEGVYGEKERQLLIRDSIDMKNNLPGYRFSIEMKNRQNLPVYISRIDIGYIIYGKAESNFNEGGNNNGN